MKRFYSCSKLANEHRTSSPKRHSIDAIRGRREVEDEPNTSSGIVHIGAGNFHRSHQESYLNELLASDFEQNKNWCYSAISVIDGDRDLKRKLKRNSFKYHIISVDSNGVTNVEKVVTLRDVFLSCEDLLSCISLLCDERINIVSLTITEVGYSQELNQYDIELINSCLNDGLVAQQGNVTAFGLILAGLARRFCLGVRPFTVMSCDNLMKNGEVCKTKCVDSAKELNLKTDFVNWIKNDVRYPSTMVDRITPFLSEADIIELEKRFNLIDQSPVFCESYKTWVIEDNFVDGLRPKWELVGSIVTDNIEPYEFMKLFLLNVPHSCIACAGLTRDYTYVHEAMDDDQLRTDLLEMVKHDVFPIMEVHIPESIDWNDYWLKTVDRFRNKHMHDTLERISRDGLEKLKKQGLKLYSEGKKIGLSMRLFKRYLDIWVKQLNMDSDQALISLIGISNVEGECDPS